MGNLILKTDKAISFLIMILAVHCSLAQNPTSNESNFNCIITNESRVSGNNLEFDLYILDTGPSEPFDLASIQIGIFVDPNFYNNGDVFASIIEGSSELINPQQPTSIAFVQTSNIIKIAARMVKPMTSPTAFSGRGTIISKIFPGTRICRIKLTNSVNFAKVPADLTFCFERNPYPTLVSKYVKGLNTPLPCNSSNCFNKVDKKLLK
jgi:hypothetical protein